MLFREQQQRRIHRQHPVLPVNAASGDHAADLRFRLPEIVDAVGHRQCFTVTRDGHQVGYWLTGIMEKFVRCPMAFM